MPVTRKTCEFTAIHQSLSGSAKMIVGVTTMPAPTMLRRKGVKEAVQRFVERVSQLPQVEAVLLAWGDEVLEMRVIVPEPDLSVVDAVGEAEGEMIDRLGELPFVSDVIFRQGKPLDEFFFASNSLLVPQVMKDAFRKPSPVSNQTQFGVPAKFLCSIHALRRLGSDGCFLRCRSRP
jgi:hypothetical protein